MIVVVLLLIAGAGAGVYFWQNQKVGDLEDQNETLTNEVQDLKATANSNDSAADDADNDTPTSSVLTEENIADAVSSGNYAALEGYMADTVRVIIAASEGVGDRTPAQAVEDMKYLDGGTDPWTFELSEETLLEWRFGDYGSYFPLSAVVGKSANNYVVSFQFNPEGKISVVFFAIGDVL